MSNLWPDFNKDIEVEDNNALHILHAQARGLAEKTGGKVKASFSKINYSKVRSNAIEAIGKLALNPVLREEVLEDDLKEKINVSDELKEQKYKFEIYTDSYRFRLFSYIYSPLYSNEMILDENIAEEIGEEQEISINSDKELIELLKAIFGSARVRKIVKLLIARQNDSSEMN